MSELNAQRTSKGRWLIAHALVMLALVVLAYALSLNVRYSATEQFPQPSALEYALVALGVPAAFWLWGWMLTDFFRNKAIRKSVAWGWFLVLGNWFAAIIYFFVVWRPRHAKT